MQDLKVLTNDQIINEFDNTKRLLNYLETKAPEASRIDVEYMLEEIKKELASRGMSEPHVDLSKKKLHKLN